MFRTDTPVDPGPRLRLGAVGQWDAAPVVGRLRSIHVAAAFATLDATLLIARAAAGASAVTVVLAAATGGVLVACLALVCAHPMIDRPAPARRIDSTARALRTLTCGLTILVLAHVAASPHPWPQTAGLPGYGPTLAWVLVTQTALLGGLGAAAVLRRHGGPRVGAPARGLGAPVIAAVATGLAVAYSAELVYRVADYLDRDAPTAHRQATSPPLAYKWAIFGFLLAVVTALVVAALVTLFSHRSRFRAASAIMARDFPDAPPQAALRLRRARTAIARARSTERRDLVVVATSRLPGGPNLLRLIAHSTPSRGPGASRVTWAADGTRRRSHAHPTAFLAPSAPR